MKNVVDLLIVHQSKFHSYGSIISRDFETKNIKGNEEQQNGENAQRDVNIAFINELTFCSKK